MTALLGLIIGMSVGIAARELWAQRMKYKGFIRSALMAAGLIAVWIPILLLMVTIFLKRPPG